MVSSAFKPAVNRAIEPIVRFAIRLGVTPDAVTIFGTLGSIAMAILFYPKGDLFLGTLAISLFVLSDLFDGAIARLSQRGASRWGGFLDSTCDRLTDASILGSFSVFCIIEDYRIYPIVLSCLVTGFLIPYVRAKAESFNIQCTVGVAERTERLILSLTAIGLQGLGVPYIMPILFWLLLLLSLITVSARIIVVYRGLHQ